MIFALSSERCPECGWIVDWYVATAGVEARRCGTCAYRASGWRLIDQTLLTIGVMLLTPWRFAVQIRNDEPLRPALAVALSSVVLFWVFRPEAFEGELYLALAATAGLVVVIIMQTLLYATAYWKRGYPRLRWPTRFRLWLTISLYSTVFVATWPLVGEPPLMLGSDVNFFFPFLSQTSSFPAGSALGVTIIVYWWWFVLANVLLIRNRPTWLAAICLLLLLAVFQLGSLAGFYVGALMYSGR